MPPKSIELLAGSWVVEDVSPLTTLFLGDLDLSDFSLFFIYSLEKDFYTRLLKTNYLIG
jgi:hypothetical protein